jgi:hypothetical protein
MAYREERYEKLIEKLGRADLGTAGLLYPNSR